MRIAISQSNYLPWVGYFSLMAKCDLFIVHDGLSYSKGSFRNRNRIGLEMLQWMTIPIRKVSSGTPISQIEVVSSHWVDNHVSLIKRLLGELPFYQAQSKVFFPQLMKLKSHSFISDINIELIKFVTNHLDLDLNYIRLVNDNKLQEKNQRLVDLVRQHGGTCYVSSIQANRYLEPSLFESFGIKLIIENYRDCLQSLGNRSRSDASIIQSLMHLGKEEIANVLIKSGAGIQVYLDELSYDDVPKLFSIQSNTQWARLRNTERVPVDLQATKLWLRNVTESKTWIRAVREISTGSFLGYVTLESTQVAMTDQMYVGIFLPLSEGTGASRQAIELVKIWAFNKFKTKLLLAKVRKENTKSQFLFEKCGFVLKESDEDYNTFELTSWENTN